jgi:cytoskeletal protein CcmA (bactofilin family)
MPFVASGATFKTGQSYYLESGVVINDNLYAVGGNININGSISGDLLAAGGNVMLSGEVLGDIAAAGGTLNIIGKVEGDARLVGGNINISNSVGGDLIIAGGQISVMPGSIVGKDVDVAGGAVYINGIVSGNLRIAAREIKIGSNAIIKGTFDYYSEYPVTLEQGAVVQGATTFHKVNVPTKTPVSKGSIFGLISITWLIKSIMIFVAALVMLYFFKNQVKAIVEKSVLGFWKEALRGFIILIVLPIAVILSFISVIGSFLGFIAAPFYGALLIASSVISVLLFAKLLLKHLFKKDNYELNWWVVAVAVLVLGLVALIPFVGWIFVLIIFISALGSTADFVWKKLRA